MAPSVDAPLNVLVTGASAGIGAEFARVFAARGHRLVLVARSLDKLDALATELRSAHGTDVVVVPLDLARKRGGTDLFAAVEQRGLQVDVLVNNAGVIHVGAFTDMDPAAANAMVQLNLGSLACTTRAFLDPMLARGFGRILNVASVAAYQPLPGMALYAASKAAVLAFGEALAEELRGTGVTVTTLCPGPTDTAMASGFNLPGMPELPAALLASPRAVAEEGVDACLAGETVRVPGVFNRMGALWSQTQPRWLLRRLGGLLGRQVYNR